MKIEKFKIGDVVKCFDPNLDDYYFGNIGKVENAVEVGDGAVTLLIRYKDKTLIKVDSKYVTHYYADTDDIDDPTIKIEMKESEFISILTDAFSGAIDSILLQLSNKEERDDDV